MRRRSLIRHAAITGAALSTQLLWPNPALGEPVSHGHNAYFANLNELLKRSGPGRPVLLIDLERMHRNLKTITDSVGPNKQYRVVVKSLPSVSLLEDVMRRAKTNALMVFHQPFLTAVAQAFPNADVLMGKPLPVSAARKFYQTLGRTKFDPSRQVQWLIDTPQRLAQYQSLAKELGVALRLNTEIDVGLHRGGLAEPNALSAILTQISKDPEHLSFAGLMGYEPQLTGLKADLKHPAVTGVLGRYRGFIDAARQIGYNPDKLTLNGAGSHTLDIYQRDDTMNDLSAGSGVVMPTDFDTFHLRHNEPALFIATPILKRYDKNVFMPNPGPDQQRLYYIYGGYWKAQMASPANIGDPLYESTNQSPITTSAAVNLQVDDYMFLRPTQSEFVMLQFGDLLAIKNGEITNQWPVFQQTG